MENPLDNPLPQNGSDPATQLLSSVLVDMPQSLRDELAEALSEGRREAWGPVFVDGAPTPPVPGSALSKDLPTRSPEEASRAFAQAYIAHQRAITLHEFGIALDCLDPQSLVYRAALAAHLELMLPCLPQSPCESQSVGAAAPTSATSVPSLDLAQTARAAAQQGRDACVAFLRDHAARLKAADYVDDGQQTEGNAVMLERLDVTGKEQVHGD